MANNNELEVLTWQDVEADVMKVNPELAQVINDLSPPKSYKIIKARYQYGDDILDKGVFHLPCKGKLYPIGSEELPGEINRSLSYSNSNMPMGFSLNKMIELHLEENNSIFPFRLFPTGKIFGLWTL